jgi:hypothetical protein
MGEAAEYCQVVRIRLRGAADEAALLQARPGFVEPFRERFPELIEARLIRLGPQLYVDTWRWTSRDAAVRALEQRERMPGYRQWDQLVEILRFDEGLVVASQP